MARTIAEYAIHRWLQENNFVMGCFKLTMTPNNNEILVTDELGDTLLLAYDRESKSVYVKE